MDIENIDLDEIFISDSIYYWEKAYKKLFKKEPPVMIIMESEEEYKEELKNAVQRKREITDGERPACDIVY